MKTGLRWWGSQAPLLPGSYFRGFTVFVLHHDRVAQREQLEELGGVLVLPGPDAGHQRVIHEREPAVSEAVPAPVHRLEEGRQKSGVRGDKSQRQRNLVTSPQL